MAASSKGELRDSAPQDTTNKKRKPAAPLKKSPQALPLLERAQRPAFQRGNEITGLLIAALAVGLFLALISFQAADLEASIQDHSNYIGAVGTYAAEVLLYTFGMGAFFFVGVLFLLGGFMLVGRRPDLKPSEFVGYGILLISGSILFHMFFAGERLLEHQAGGLLGQLLGDWFSALIGGVGTWLLASCLTMLALMLITDRSLGQMLLGAGRLMERSTEGITVRALGYREYRRQLRQINAPDDDPEARELARQEAIAARARALLEARQQKSEPEPEPEPRKAAAKTPPPPPQAPPQAPAQAKISRAKALPEEAPAPAAAAEAPAQERPGLFGRLFGLLRRAPEAAEPDEADLAPYEPTRGTDLDALAPSKRKVAPKNTRKAAPALTEQREFEFHGLSPYDLSLGEPSLELEIDLDDAEEEEDGLEGPHTLDAAPQTLEGRQRVPVAVGADAGGADYDGLTIVETEAQRAARERRALLERQDSPVPRKRAEPGQFQLPPLNFLSYQRPEDHGIDEERLRAMANLLTEKLLSFGVHGQVVEIRQGPVITMFEFLPAAGVKISKIAGLSDDLAMALSALSVRIIAPIPGKGVVGIEVPNDYRETVYLKEIIADDCFQSSKARMPVALGKDTEGGPVVTDLSAMPHLLVAGSTGSGKSVAVNTMIVSLLFRFTPEEVRLIMIDPKMLEFSIYEGIPHLLLPVVTDPQKAAAALQWAVGEMERRYQMLSEMAVRNIASYNKRVEALTKQYEEDLEAGRTRTEASLRLQVDEEGVPQHRCLPNIVCIIDEFADLMMVASKDVETAVARLAQKARAAGIHLILATQRPSVDVITGLIKANFPTRLALRVAQKTDSRTILDSNGAESLLGRGDMLFLPPGSSQQSRVHGAFVADDEIEKIVKFLKAQGSPEYDSSILETQRDTSAGSGGDEEDEYDALYDEAVVVVATERQASISMLQRRLRVGYNRAARMIERMERDGVVGPSDGVRPRDVLAPPPNY